MMFFARWKTAAILAVCLLGALVCVPNFFPKSALPGWARQFSLGLDLRGGSYLLLEVDMNAVVRERLEGLADGARTRLRQQNIGYVNLAADPAQRRITFRLRDASQAPTAIAQLREAGQPDPDRASVPRRPISRSPPAPTAPSPRR